MAQAEGRSPHQKRYTLSESYFRGEDVRPGTLTKKRESPEPETVCPNDGTKLNHYAMATIADFGNNIIGSKMTPICIVCGYRGKMRVVLVEVLPKD
jgi:hypothetical protein